MNIQLNTDDLRPLVAEIVREVVSQLGVMPEKRMTEQEAASLFGVHAHTLRDARRRGELECDRVGRYVRYTHQQLEDWQVRMREANE